ncbi:MAG: FHA domain-containing protein [Lachnospiraceae bacterium]|nr:FHA domain-containing protein [Lachnospiraceae bacterium]
MFTAEYVRTCNCNYERIVLAEKPQERRYQYCILSRGGIRYLLPCSLRYIDGAAYLYYDITSTQNVVQLFAEKPVGREWMKDFLWGVRQMRQELDRFLLEENNVIWNPEQIFQDLEKNDFFFLYMPYHEGENGLEEFMDYLVEHVDYEDEALVEFVYSAYEKVRKQGLQYMHKLIHEDFAKMEKSFAKKQAQLQMEEKAEAENGYNHIREEQPILEKKEQERKGIRFFREGRKRKATSKDEYRERVRQRLNGMPVMAVCEESVYESDYEPKASEGDFAEEFGKTIYIEETPAKSKPALYKSNGEKVVELEKMPFVIGKKKENVDLALNDYSVSRIHARITEEEGLHLIEDLNSTNGTYKNGLRLHPYEKRKLESGDELRFGKTEYVYR